MTKILREIFLVRHGETDFNRQGIVQGRGVNSSLNENGIKQAKAFFEHFKHIHFDAVFASTLQRTHQTLEPFVQQGYKLIVHEELDEIHEGRTSDREMHNEFFKITNNWREGILHEKISGGESPLELQQRQLRFINEILPNYKGTILICSHGRAMRSLLCTMLNKNLSEMDSFPHTNLSLYKLVHRENRFEIDWHNYTQHLNEL
jgi:2,3-bisphosphoglycerate-dependent phosphoglycerate mutase